MKYGPSRRELWFRLAFSVAGLALMAVAVSVRSPTGPAWVEVVGFAGLFFGGTALWTLWQLFGGPRR